MIIRVAYTEQNPDGTTTRYLEGGEAALYVDWVRELFDGQNVYDTATLHWKVDASVVAPEGG